MSLKLLTHYVDRIYCNVQYDNMIYAGLCKEVPMGHMVANSIYNRQYDDCAT